MHKIIKNSRVHLRRFVLYEFVKKLTFFLYLHNYNILNSNPNYTIVLKHALNNQKFEFHTNFFPLFLSLQVNLDYF